MPGFAVSESELLVLHARACRLGERVVSSTRLGLPSRRASC